MATARQLARNEIKASLEKELNIAKQNVRQNLLEFKKLAIQQETLKRKVSEIHNLIQHLEKL